MNDVVHFLRHNAANKEVAVSLLCSAPFSVAAEGARLQTLLIGLVADAIDATPAGMELPITVSREDGFAVVSIGSNAGYPVDNATDDLSHELTRHFARQFLSTKRGRLEIDRSAPPQGSLRLYYPMQAKALSLRVSVVGREARVGHREIVFQQMMSVQIHEHRNR